MNLKSNHLLTFLLTITLCLMIAATSTYIYGKVFSGEIQNDYERHGEECMIHKTTKGVILFTKGLKLSVRYQNNVGTWKIGTFYRHEISPVIKKPVSKPYVPRKLTEEIIRQAESDGFIIRTEK